MDFVVLKSYTRKPLRIAQSTSGLASKTNPGSNPATRAVLTFLSVQFCPVPIHVIFLVQDFEDLTFTKGQFVIGCVVEVVLGHGLHALDVEFPAFVDSLSLSQGWKGPFGRRCKAVKIR